MLSPSITLTALLLVGELASASSFSSDYCEKKVASKRNPSRRAAGSNCSFTIKSAADTAAAKSSKCTTINIEALTVPDATIFDLKNLVDNAVVNLKGNLDVCGKTPWADGPCIQISGKNVTFNGNDCLAINKGSDITFRRNYCLGGHGVSIGSIQQDKSVSNVLIEGNTIVNQTNGLRIKTVVGAKNASVSDITYIGNHATGISDVGVIIQQDYLNGGPTGIPSSDIPITNIKFLGADNTLRVNDGALQVKVLCGTGTCSGNWDWSSLKTSGGLPGYITPSEVPITGYTLSK